jgi:hypothetical protein
LTWSVNDEEFENLIAMVKANEADYPEPLVRAVKALTEDEEQIISAFQSFAQ